MKKIKEEKLLTYYINITYENSEEGFKQKFNIHIDNKRYLRFILDKRYLFKDKFEALLDKYLLKNVSFERRNDLEDCVEMIYKSSPESIPSPIIVTISDYFPPNTGCEYCQYAEKEKGCINCSLKKKYVQGTSRCTVFKSKKKIIT